jgi:hypothetical protein
MRYFFAFLAAVALILVVFILIVRGFGGRSPKLTTELVDYAKTQTVVRMSVEGPVVLDENHYQVRVTVGRDSNTLQLRKGYESRVVNTKSYDNNETAYAVFLRALQLQGYTKGNDDPERADSRGFCPSGKVYTFEIITGSDAVQRFWTTSCGGGTFKGNATLIRKLFREQAPDYFRTIRGTSLN